MIKSSAMFKITLLYSNRKKVKGLSEKERAVGHFLKDIMSLESVGEWVHCSVDILIVPGKPALRGKSVSGLTVGS